MPIELRCWSQKRIMVEKQWNNHTQGPYRFGSQMGGIDCRVIISNMGAARAAKVMRDVSYYGIC